MHLMAGEAERVRPSDDFASDGHPVGDLLAVHDASDLDEAVFTVLGVDHSPRTGRAFDGRHDGVPLAHGCAGSFLRPRGHVLEQAFVGPYGSRRGLPRRYSLGMMNDDERYFTDLTEAFDAVRRIELLINQREVVISRVRIGEWKVLLSPEGQVGRVSRRTEGKAVYFVGYLQEDPEEVNWVSDDIDRVLERIVMLA